MSLTGASTDKKSLRQQVKAMRLAQEAAAAKRRSDEICDRLLEIKEIRAADRVFVYAAARGEADLEKLVEDVSFNAPDMTDKTVVIDDKYVDDKLAEIVKSSDLSQFIL